MTEGNEALAPPRGTRKPWWERHGAPIALAALGILGMLVGKGFPAVGPWYWGLLVPLFMVVSTVMEERRRRGTGQGFWETAGRQALHWLGLALALWTLLLASRGGTIPADTLSPIALLLLALSSFLAGVHFHRGFLLASLLMAAGVLVGTWFEKHILWVLGAVIVWLAVQVWRVKRRAARRAG